MIAYPQEKTAEAVGRGAAGRLRVLIYTHDFPIFPGGIPTEYLNSIGLARLGAEVGLVSMVHTAEQRARRADLERQGVRTYAWEIPELHSPCSAAPATPRVSSRLHRHFAQVLAWWRAWPGRPADAVLADLCFRNMAPALTQALCEHPWDVLLVVQSSSAAVVDYVPRPAVSALLMHDIRSVVFERRARVARGAWQRLMLQRQARRYRRFEKKYASRYDLVIAVSEHDARWIAEHCAPRRVLALPLPVDSDYFRPGAQPAEVPNRIVFTGLMNHPPNVDAAVFFARGVLPAVRRLAPDAEFYVVGRNPAPEVLELGGLPGVVVTGTVPDVRPYLESAAVVVVPLRAGSGARNKILEAWAMERCVVSTSIGAEGLEYREGVDIVIADGADGLAKAVARVLKDRNHRERIRCAGRGHASGAYHPDRIAGQLFQEFQTLTGARACSERMRIALDMRWMVPGVAGGIEDEARGLLNELIRLDRHNEYTVILPAVCRYDFDLRSAPNFRALCLDSFGSQWRDFCWRTRRGLHRLLGLDHWESAEVRGLRHLREFDSQIVYSSPGYIYPDVYPLRHVVKVPDLQHEFYPEYFTREALEERRRLYGEAVRRADHVTTGSEFSRQTLIERLGVEPDKITVVPLAADSVFRPMPPAAAEAALREYGLRPGSYMFFPAHTWRHKNHRAAVSALQILRDRRCADLMLVCTGEPREAQAEIEQQIDSSGLKGRVAFLGYCPREVMPALYSGAQCLVFPSLFEGFGIPVVEAMRSGCPVVCSNATSLPEVAGDAALLVDPNDPEALAAAIGRILDEPGLRASLASRGLEQASRFSWRKHALETLDVWRRVHARMYGFQGTDS
jgi:glycosyltransferase involved in cell wall biosynthesis